MDDAPDRKHQSLGGVIRTRRIELGLTQEELAERVGENVRQSDISRLERNYVGLPRRARLEALALALDLSLGELLMRSGWIDPSIDVRVPGSGPAEPDAEPLVEHHKPVTPEPLGVSTTHRDDDADDALQLRAAIARAREVSRHTRDILRESEQTLDELRRRTQDGSRV